MEDQLLVSKDKLLVKIAAEALKLLCIEDIQEKGEPNEEDLIFEFTHVNSIRLRIIPWYCLSMLSTKQITRIS